MLWRLPHLQSLLRGPCGWAEVMYGLPFTVTCPPYSSATQDRCVECVKGKQAVCVPQWAATKPAKACTFCAVKKRPCEPTAAFLEMVKALRPELAVGGRKGMSAYPHRPLPFSADIFLAATPDIQVEGPPRASASAPGVTTRPRRAQRASGNQGTSGTLPHHVPHAHDYLATQSAAVRGSSDPAVLEALQEVARNQRALAGIFLTIVCGLGLETPSIVDALSALSIAPSAAATTSDIAATSATATTSASATTSAAARPLEADSPIIALGGLSLASGSAASRGSSARSSMVSEQSGMLLSRPYTAC